MYTSVFTKIFFHSNLKKNFKLAEKLKQWFNEYSYTHYPESAIHGLQFTFHTEGFSYKSNITVL